jgi:hypothetical protein
MLSAESASGQWPVEAVSIMDRIATSGEADPGYLARVHFTETLPDATTNDAIAAAAAKIVGTVGAAAIVCFTTSGSTARRVSRERPSVPLLILTPSIHTARRLGLLWGSHAVRTRDVGSFEEMIAKAKRMALRHALAHAGERIIITAGVPFGTPGSTNVVHVARLIGDELERHRPPETYRESLVGLTEQAGALQPADERFGVGEEMGVHADGLGTRDIVGAIVDEEGLVRGEAETGERAVIDGGVGLQQLFLARYDDRAEATEEGLLARAERCPEIGREIGDGKKRHVERVDDRVDARHGIANRLAEMGAPGRDQMGIMGKVAGQLRGGLGKGTAAVQRLVPREEIDILDETAARGRVPYALRIKAFRFPAVEDVADIEDDGGRGGKTGLGRIFPLTDDTHLGGRTLLSPDGP